jgi:hypothetical protein
VRKTTTRKPSGRRIGRDNEERVATKLGGHIHTGQDADVEHERIRVEAKHRKGLRLDSTSELREWAEQVERYEKANPGRRFTIQVCGGREFQNAKMWFFVSEDHYKALTNPANPGMILVELQRIRELLESGTSEI